MTVTSQVMAHTPITGSGYSILEASKKRSVVKWMEAKEVRTDNWWQWVPGDETFDQMDIETGQSHAPFITTNLSVAAGVSDEQISVDSTALFRVGDQVDIEQYYNGSTTEFDHSLTKRSTILSIDSSTTMTLDREEAEVADGSYTLAPIDSRVKVVSRAQNYNTPFPDAITFRGDMLINHPQRFDSGEITYDLAAVSVPDFEAPNGHYMRDVMYWKKELPVFRNDAAINGRKRTGNYNATPKIPYRMGGAIWSAEQVGTNLEAIDGQLNFFDFSDIFEDMETNHADGAGDTIWMAPRMVTIWSEMLLPYKGMFGPGENTLNIASNVKFAFGSVSQNGVKTDNRWPASKILITSKKDWKKGHFIGMNWTYVERGPKELGAFQKSWTMGGDFAQVCENVSHQRLLTGIDTRKDLYPARTSFL
jgi:hypothetical protein